MIYRGLVHGRLAHDQVCWWIFGLGPKIKISEVKCEKNKVKCKFEGTVSEIKLEEYYQIVNMIYS